MSQQDWAAEVPISEPDRSSIPMWTIKHVKSSTTVLRIALGSHLLDEMATWLQHRSTGAWRFIERERVSGRASVLYRSFQFERQEDACEFVRAWSDALIQLRIASLQTSLRDASRSAPSLSLQDYVGYALTFLVDVLPSRWRIAHLNRLRRRKAPARCAALIERESDASQPS